MPLFEGAWNFVKRHRRKIVILGIVLGGAALLKRYSDRKLREWAESERIECMDRLRREQHFDSTRSTCKTTIVNLIPNLNDRLVTIFECESLTQRIIKRPANRLTLWEELKRKSFARLVVQVYGSALLVTMLNVQLNVMGGYMFVDVQANVMADDRRSVNQAPAKMSRSVQQKYLNVVHNFLGDGVEKLASTLVQDAVERVIGDVHLKDKLSIANIQESFATIQRILETDVVARCSSLLGVSNLASQVVLQHFGPSSSTSSTSTSSKDDAFTLARILDETTDLLESDDCAKVLALTVQAGFSVVADALLERFASSPQNSSKQLAASEQLVAFLNPNDLSLPMAKVIPMVVDVGNRLLIGDLSEHFLLAMFALDAQKVVGANIYESFSQRSSRPDGDSSSITTTGQ